jgi:hypothetical protein
MKMMADGLRMGETSLKLLRWSNGKFAGLRIAEASSRFDEMEDSRDYASLLFTGCVS